MCGKDGCRLRSEAAITTIFTLVKEMLFSSGKNQRILKNDVYGNHDLSPV